MDPEQLLQEITRLLNEQEQHAPQQQQGTPARLRVVNLFLPADYLDGQTITAPPPPQSLDAPSQTPEQPSGGEEEETASHLLWVYEEEEEEVPPPVSSCADEYATQTHQPHEETADWSEEEEEQIQAHFIAAEQERAQQEEEETRTHDAQPLDDGDEEEEHDAPWRIAPPSRRVLLLALACLVALLSGMAVAYVTWLPTATVMIIPASQTITVTRTLTITTTTGGVPGASTTATTTIPGRLLPTLAASQQKTVSTTGQGHTDAQAANGLITFYNSALFSQTIPAGTLLTGADGVQIVTDADAVIPAGSLSVNGQVTVSAHAVEVGPQGNISAGDIYGPCCRQNVMAANTAFHGGTLARDYRVVSKQDLDQATQSLTSTLNTSIQTAEENQVNAGESLVMPLLCSSATTSSDHQVGEEAQTVSVTVQESCTGVVYATSAMQQVMMQASASEASKTLGSGYRLVSTPQLTVTLPAHQQQQQQQGQMTVQVKSVSVWAYQFSSSQLESMRTAIAGMGTQTATKWLLHLPGVQQVMFSGTNNDADVLPQDASRIHIDVLHPSW